MSPGRVLTGVRAPDEPGAETRAWEVVRAAYVERSPGVQRAALRRPLAAFVGSLVLVAALALSPAGATVGHLITRALGVQKASPHLFPLPSPGRLLVSGRAGTWTVASSGSIHRLGPWAQASWSPHGRYLAVVGPDRLAAVNGRGALQWSLIRPDVADPTWYPPSGYRIAYLSGASLRVVAGDGTGDDLLARGVAGVAPAWRPGHAYQLAYVTAHGRIAVREADGPLVWSARTGIRVEGLAWSAGGQDLVVVARSGVEVYRGNGTLAARWGLPSGSPATAAALAPDGRTLALVIGGGEGGVVIEDIQGHGVGFRRVLAGNGVGQIAWSPDGDWLLVSWPAADQWVFVRTAGTPRLAAVSRIARQFASRQRHAFPQLEGWCCTAR